MATSVHHNKGEDVIDQLITDHKEVKELFGKIKQDINNSRPHLEAVIKELNRHNLGEEQLFYPVMRFILPNGEKLNQEAIHETYEATTAAEKLLKLRPGVDVEYEREVLHFMDDVLKHAEKEETQMFPLVKQKVEQGDLCKMSELLKKLKSADPSAPNSKLPAEPPAVLDVASAYKKEVLEFLADMKMKYSGAARTTQ